MLVVLVAVISLSLSAIWPNAATAAEIPEIVSLGQLQEGLNTPGRMDIDAQGNLYVADARTNRIIRFDSAGTLQDIFAVTSVSGAALAVNAEGTLIYTTERGGRVVILDGLTGDFINYLGELTTTGDIAVDPLSGDVYVVDTANIQVVRYSSAGVELDTVSGAGEGDGLFLRISELAIKVVPTDATKTEIYVVGEYRGVGEFAGRSGSSTVQIFNFEGVYQSTIGDTDMGGALSNCKGIAFGPNGLEFYLDRSGTVRILDRTDGYLSTYSVKGIGAGLMQLPVDLVYDATSDRLLVASDTFEIEIFGVNGGTTPLPNQPPSLPVLVSPIAGGEANSATPQLRFVNSTDENVDSLTYDVELIGFPLRSTPQHAGTESYVTTGELSENTLYTWKALARDEHGVESGWTAEQIFIVNAVNEAPTAPILSGIAGETLNGNGLLAWSESTDPDPNDALFYRVEVAEDITFTDSTLVEELNATEIQLIDFADYIDLQDGINYVWRVTAVDTDNLSTASEIGNFVYDTAMLTVSANMPDALVYLSGNAAYAGDQVGVAPVEFRDIPAGSYTVVVERAGCEQFVAQVEIAGSGNADISAILNLAVAPSLRSDADLRIGKSKLRVGMNAAPFAVDFNNDGMVDLLVADSSGALNLFVALSQRGSRVQYDVAQPINTDPVAGAVPFVVDWNNDNRKDLLIGGTDGRVMLFLQEATSSDLQPTFAAGTPLKVNALNDLTVGSAANPAVVDIDNDGDKDLIVGTAAGELYSFLNVGTDAEPLLADAVTVGSFQGRVAPLFIDWDADGQRDLLISHAGALMRCAKAEDGTFSVAETLLSSRATLADPAVRFFVVDLDSEQGKDVFAGFSDGKVTYFRSSGRDYLPSVTEALLDKVAQVQALALADGTALQFDAVAAAITAVDLTTAGKLAEALLVNVPTGGDLEIATVELLELLSR
jgi:hypothetical protein